MKFELATEQSQSLVKAVPTHPKGCFIFDSPDVGKITAREVELRRVRPWHVSAFQVGNDRIIRGYVAPRPERPGVFQFTRGDPYVPGFPQLAGAPLPGIETLPDLHDKYQAVAAWWAQRLLRPTIDLATSPITHHELPPEFVPKVDTFANVLAALTRANDTPYLRIDFVPNQTLRDAAALAEVPAVFSLKSSTDARDDGAIVAKEGYTGEVVQIWPPPPEGGLPPEA